MYRRYHFAPAVAMYGNMFLIPGLRRTTRLAQCGLREGVVGISFRMAPRAAAAAEMLTRLGSATAEKAPSIEAIAALASCCRQDGCWPASPDEFDRPTSWLPCQRPSRGR